MKIKEIHAREILDSNGRPTISTYIELWSGISGTGDVPSGASTGKTEVREMRDSDENGVSDAIGIINTRIRDLVVDKELSSQKDFDELLIKEDGTELKEKLGGNTILSCSMAFARAVSNELGLNLYEYLGMIYWDKEYSKDKFVMPTPQILVLEGGKHGNWATDIQEYMVVPDTEKFGTFLDSLKATNKIISSIHDILEEKDYSLGLGFEGAYAPKEIKSNYEAFEIIMEGIERCGFGEEDFKLALDLASSEFFDDEEQRYILKREDKKLNREDWISLQKDWYQKLPIYSLEDPLSQDDWEGWVSYTEEMGDMYQVVGDDLLTTNPKRIRMSIERKATNAILIKLNQIGTVTETLDAIRVTVENNMQAIVSHRSGETNDSFIADLVIATPANQSKFGGLRRGERLAKYNRLLEIEEDLHK